MNSIKNNWAKIVSLGYIFLFILSPVILPIDGLIDKEFKEFFLIINNRIDYALHREIWPFAPSIANALFLVAVLFLLFSSKGLKNIRDKFINFFIINDEDTDDKKRYSILRVSIFGVLLFVLIPFPWIFNYLYGMSDGNLAFETSTSGVKVTMVSGEKKQTLNVVTVPAYSIFTDSGICLQHGDTVEISATGLVQTGTFFDFDKIWKEDSKAQDLITQIINARYLKNSNAQYIKKGPVYELTREVFKMQYGNEHNFLWRNPDGKYDTCVDDKSTKIDSGDESEKAHNENKLLPNEAYGCLLGYIVPENKKPSEILASKIDKNRIFVIGKKCAPIIFSANKIYIPNQEKPIEYPWPKAYLYLMVNDIIVKKNTIQYISKNTHGEKNYYDLQHTNFIDNVNKIVQDETKQDRFIESIWYHDNKGQFTVTLIQKRGK